VALTISAVRDEAGKVANYVGLFTDITERKAREDRIRFLSEHDTLTGLPNRALLQDRVGQAIAQARRTGGHIALMFIDLDAFKPINDTLGHHIGDHLLQEVARRLVSSVRESDTVSRQGGDEFLVMLPDIDSTEDVERVAEKLMAGLAEACSVGGHVLQVSASIGISLYPDDGADLDALVRAADTAMYHSKACGRACYRFSSQAINTMPPRDLAQAECHARERS
jgi:diguanylate cyclase (GGDEF)-like protein